MVCYPQRYKRWFIESGACTAGEFAVGYAIRNPQSDTSYIQASFVNGCMNYALYKSCVVWGYRLNRGTDFDTLAIEETLQEEIDSSYFIYALQNFRIADTLIVNNLVCTIIGNGDIKEECRDFIGFNTRKPEWLAKPPESENSIYVTGISPYYFYEASSWLSAENNGRKQLAAYYYSEIESLEKKENKIGDSIIREELSSALSGISVISRYYDSKEKIYYVLMKMDLK